jgi:hypothetical protein
MLSILITIIKYMKQKSCFKHDSIRNFYILLDFILK